MLSRLSLYGIPKLTKSIVKFQPISTIHTSAIVATDSTQAKNYSTDVSKYPPEYPPATSKRDFVNYPRLTIPELPPPVRLGFIPESWFQFFYPKTGYTGPYVFMMTVGTYLFSKEKIVLEHNFGHMVAMVMAVMFIHYKLGPMVAKFYNKAIEQEVEYLDSSQKQEIEDVQNEINEMKSVAVTRDAMFEALQANAEAIYLQMEMNFRERLEQIHKKVKDKLDCQLELENSERRIQQKNLMDYVMRNVMKSITPDLEKNYLQMCINDLTTLSAKA